MASCSVEDWAALHDWNLASAFLTSCEIGCSRLDAESAEGFADFCSDRSRVKLFPEKAAKRIRERTTSKAMAAQSDVRDLDCGRKETLPERSLVGT